MNHQRLAELWALLELSVQYPDQEAYRSWAILAASDPERFEAEMRRLDRLAKMTERLQAFEAARRRHVDRLAGWRVLRLAALAPATVS